MAFALPLVLVALLPAYEPVPGIAGTVRLVGSDTLAALNSAWADAFRRHYPAVAVEVQAVGSSSAPPALAEATADIGAMSRRLGAAEQVVIAEARGAIPLEVVVAQDAVAVVVHRSNPLTSVSLAELDAVFSQTRLCADRAPVRRWAELGVAGELADRPIDLFGRNAVSGTYAFFRRSALCDGDFSPTIAALAGTGAIVSRVARTPTGIGYVGLSYATPEVRTLAVRHPRDGRPVEPSLESTVSGRYPLSRPLFLYVGRDARSRPSRVALEYVRFALSDEGRAITVALGFVPPDGAAAGASLRRLEAELGLP